jgi:hypothetical protein
MRKSISYGIRYVILFMIAIFGVAIIAVAISPYRVPDIPVDECAKYLGKTFCDLLYGST